MSETKKYMTFEDIRLKQPLSVVKRSKDKNDTLVIPDNFINTIVEFLNAENIEYHTIENPTLYPADKLEAGLKRFEDADAAFSYEDPVLLITPFDAESLFQWAKQLYGETKDPSYAQYREDRRKAADEFYHTQYEYRPD